MVVHDTDGVRPVFAPNEHDPPLTVDADRMFASPIASERLQPIARRKSQIIYPFGRIYNAQLSPRRDRKLARKPPRQTAREDQSGGLVAKTPDHDRTYCIVRGKSKNVRVGDGSNGRDCQAADHGRPRPPLIGVAVCGRDVRVPKIRRGWFKAGASPRLGGSVCSGKALGSLRHMGAPL
jgi:hypothetical protein